VGVRFSVVIPARNEEKYLPRLLETVEAAREAYGGGAQAIETIVADNVSTDRTAEVARTGGARVVAVEKRVIGAVRNAGATAALGEVLVFVDADIQMHRETFNEVDRALLTGRVVGGATGVRLERLSIGLAITYAALMPMVWLTRMDTGPTFCLKADFEALGGYDESLRVAEDVALLVALTRLGRRRGQRLTRLRRAKAIASVRKFDAYGDWHYFRIMPKVALELFSGRRNARGVIDDYWYGDRR
jgi:glycosyltransferase involved in cell wall biosynthesis